MPEAYLHYLPFEGNVIYIRRVRNNTDPRDQLETFLGAKGETLQKLPLEWNKSTWMDYSGVYQDDENVLTVDGDSLPTWFNGERLRIHNALSLSWFQPTEVDGGIVVSKKDREQKYEEKPTRRPMTFMGDL